MDRKVSKNIDYADKKGIPYVLFIGEKEIKSKRFKLKDLNSGKESFLSLNNIIKKLK